MRTLRKRVIIGENMRRVKAAARLHRAGYYQAWKIDPFDPDFALKRNRAWIRRKMSEGSDILDIGIDANRVARSPFYAEEKQILLHAGYPVTRLY